MQRQLLDVQLSPHFKLSEFAQHSPPHPVPAYMERQLRRLCIDVLEPLRKVFGTCHVLSGCRTVAHNTEVGGAPASYHIYSRRRRAPAADVAFERGTPQQWAERADKLLQSGGLGVYPTHIHVDQRGFHARW